MSEQAEQTDKQAQREHAKEYQPSQVSGQLKAAQGAVYTAIGSVIPEAAGSSSWIESGEKLTEAGNKEVNDAKRRQASEAVVDSGVAKLKSATGYLTGNQDLQSRGNVEAESAQWKFKQGMSSGVAAVPIPSAEGVKGKVESVVGMVTGDQGKQMEGNKRAEEAAWRDGV